MTASAQKTEKLLNIFTSVIRNKYKKKKKGITAVSFLIPRRRYYFQSPNISHQAQFICFK